MSLEEFKNTIGSGIVFITVFSASVLWTNKLSAQVLSRDSVRSAESAAPDSLIQQRDFFYDTLSSSEQFSYKQLVGTQPTGLWREEILFYRESLIFYEEKLLQIEKGTPEYVSYESKRNHCIEMIRLLKKNPQLPQIGIYKD